MKRYKILFVLFLASISAFMTSTAWAANHCELWCNDGVATYVFWHGADSDFSTEKAGACGPLEDNAGNLHNTYSIDVNCSAL